MKILGKDIPCGCEQRKEVMGAGDWQRDAIVIGALILIVCCVIGKDKLLK